MNMTLYMKEKTVHYLVTVCFCHVTYVFESESTRCLNVKELLARSRREPFWPNG